MLMRFVIAMLLLACPLHPALHAEEPAPEPAAVAVDDGASEPTAAEAPAASEADRSTAPADSAGASMEEGSLPGWAQALIGLISIAISTFLTAFLKNKAKEANANAKKAEFDASKSLLEQKNFLINNRLMPFLWNTAAYLTEERIPIYLDRLQGGASWDSIKDDLVGELKNLAIKKFAAEGIDIVEAIGEDALVGLINRALVEKLPIPNGFKDPAKFLVEKAGGWLTDKGVAWVRNKVNRDEDLGEDRPLQPAAAGA